MKLDQNNLGKGLLEQTFPTASKFHENNSYSARCDIFVALAAKRLDQIERF